jgi:hypothetical protein
MLVLGYMLHPKCERSAHQLARIVAEETIAKVRESDYLPGEIFQSQLDGRLIARLLLAGQAAIRVCKNFQRDGAADFSKAIHVVSELNATNKTLNGKPLPTAEGRLRKTFSEFQSSIHFWAAAYTHYPHADKGVLTGIDAINEMHVSSEFLGQFLAVAKQYEDMLDQAKPVDAIWSASDPAQEIWDFNTLPKLSPLPIESDEALQALTSYRTRKKS